MRESGAARRRSGADGEYGFMAALPNPMNLQTRNSDAAGFDSYPSRRYDGADTCMKR